MTAEAGPASRTPLEVELKYQVSDIAVGRRLVAASELAGLTATGALSTVRLADRYVDTRDGALARAGWAARVRRTAEGSLISLKGLARQDAGGALHRRSELNGEADPARPPTEWAPSEARDRLVEVVDGRPLAELVTLSQTRYQRRYAGGEVELEASADQVEVVLDGQVVDRFAELELELRAGDEASLEPVMAWLDEREALVAVAESKLQRALGAVQRRAAAPKPAPVRARARRAVPTAPAGDGSTPGDGSARDAAAPAVEAPAVETPAVETPAVEMPPTPRIPIPKSPGVLADDALAEAGRKVLRFHLARMVAREAGTRESSDPEELHHMRVATRRQRAAWRVFGDGFDRKRTARYRRRLRRVAADLGAVRDLDVLIESAQGYQGRQSRVEAAALNPLIEAWRERRESARGVLLRELDSSAYRRWLDGYITFVQSEGQGVRSVGPTEPHRVRDTMPSRIWTAYEAMRAYEPVMRWADVSTLHDLRIAAKRFRYTLEFVREALGPDAGPMIAKVVAIQDHIGWLHDADVAAGLARAFLVEHAADLTELESAAIGRYLVDRERELARLRRHVGQPWRGVSSLAYRRTLGKLVAGL